METALYCPEVGYYERGHALVGQRGDFCTSVSVGPVFGRLLAVDFAKKLGTSGWQRPQIIEAGAHDGQLAADILSALAVDAPELAKQVEYWIVEPSVTRRRWQEEKLAAFKSHVRWASAWSQIHTGVTGIIFSNELLDAFPIRRWGWNAAEQRWFEWGVDWNGERFVWARLPIIADEQSPLGMIGLEMTPGNMQQLQTVLPDDFTVETNPGAIAWWRSAAEALQTGWLMTLDYGLTADALLRPERCEGTLRAYRGQRFGNDVLAEPGGQDLTAHVNFTVIEQAGRAAGLRTDLLDLQERYLGAVLAEALRGSSVSFSPEELRQAQTLIHPAHFGRSFRVLLQSRGVT